MFFFIMVDKISKLKLEGRVEIIEEIENIFRSRDYCKDICVVPLSRGDSKLYTDLIFYIQRDDKVKKNKEYFFNISRKLMYKLYATIFHNYR